MPWQSGFFITSFLKNQVCSWHHSLDTQNFGDVLYGFPASLQLGILTLFKATTNAAG